MLRHYRFHRTTVSRWAIKLCVSETGKANTEDEHNRITLVVVTATDKKH